MDLGAICDRSDLARRSDVEGLDQRTVPFGGFNAPFPALDPYFMLVNWGNTGTAFGLLRGIGGMLAMAALIIIVLVMIFFAQSPGCSTIGASVCLALILGGAIGNQIDQLRVGHVHRFLLLQAPVGDRNGPVSGVQRGG